MPEMPLLPAELPLGSPDRVRGEIDETNVTRDDIRDALWEYSKLLSRWEVDKSLIVKKALKKAARKLSAYAEMNNMRVRRIP